MKNDKVKSFFKKKSVIVSLILLAIALIVFGVVMGVCYSINPGTYSGSTIKFNGAEFDISVKNAGWTDERIWFFKNESLEWIIDKIKTSEKGGFKYIVEEKTIGIYAIEQLRGEEEIKTFFLRQYEDNKYVIALSEEMLYFE